MDQPPKKKRGRPRNDSKVNESSNEKTNVDIKDEKQEVVLPKKRGRKPKPKPLVEEPKVYKKRGRKPKPKTEEDLNKIPKKRGRKPKDKFGLIPSNDISLKPSEEHVILHLPIKTKDLESNEIIEQKLLRYNPEILIPKPFEPEINAHPLSNYSELDDLDGLNDSTLIDDSNINTNIKLDIKEIIKEPEKVNFVEPAESNDNLNETLFKINEQRKEELSDCNVYNDKSKNSDIMMEYKDSNIKQIWPNKINISCFWCCHNFDTKPYGIPKCKIADTYHMFGNFCSAECAAAYNFDSQEGSSVVWERYSLLNLLYKESLGDSNNNIKLAPPRMTLRKFGGNLSIEEFRSINVNYYKDFKITFPPMLAVIPTMEERNVESNHLKEQRYVPLDGEKIKTADAQLKLKRTKPLPDFKNTLENCMQLRYV